MRLRAGLPSLRRIGERTVLRGAFADGCERFGFRLVEYSIQSNHIHLIAEAEGTRSLSRGMQGLGVRVAKRLNKWWGRRGTVFDDRYHGRILRTPREVRNALVYVLHNAKRHGRDLRARADAYSSGPWFTGWREVQVAPGIRRPFARARTWLLARGWRRHGLVGLGELPAARAPAAGTAG
jgi:REP element-mobilizing transposase RayT